MNSIWLAACMWACVYLLSLSERCSSLMNCSISSCCFLSCNSSICNTVVNWNQYLIHYLLQLQKITWHVIATVFSPHLLNICCLILLWKPAGKLFPQSIRLTRPSCLSCFSPAINDSCFSLFLYCIFKIFSYRSEALQCREALFPSGSGFLKGLVPLEEFLNLVHGEAEVFTGNVGLLSNQPGLRHRGVPRKLTHLQHWR